MPFSFENGIFYFPVFYYVIDNKNINYAQNIFVFERR